jgi:hypothetical protein
MTDARPSSKTAANEQSRPHQTQRIIALALLLVLGLIAARVLFWSPTSANQADAGSAEPEDAGSASSGSLVIRNAKFVDLSIPDGHPSTVELQSTNGALLVKASKPGLALRVIDGKDTLWGSGSKHTWLGKNNSVFGYTISSDEAEPLQFIVTRDRGYVYLQGKGSITPADGERIDGKGNVRMMMPVNSPGAYDLLLPPAPGSTVSIGGLE